MFSSKMIKVVAVLSFLSNTQAFSEINFASNNTCFDKAEKTLLELQGKAHEMFDIQTQKCDANISANDVCFAAPTSRLSLALERAQLTYNNLIDKCGE